MKHLGGHRYAISDLGREIAIGVDRLKPYIPKLEGKAIPCNYHVDLDSPPVEDRWVVGGILGHKKLRNGKTGNYELHWKVGWKGHDEYTWEPSSSFMHALNEEWIAYNKKHKLPDFPSTNENSPSRARKGNRGGTRVGRVHPGPPPP